MNQRQGAFDYIEDIRDKSMPKERRQLTQEDLNQIQDLKQQKLELQRQINAINPDENRGLKRTQKRNEAMEHLLRLSEMNKELKSVGWMNSAEAADEQFSRDRKKPEEKQKYKGWIVDASRDISGDNIPDVIIYDENGAVRGVNGNTIRKSKYPERQLYTKENPSADERRAMRDPKTGTPLNFEEDKEGNKTKRNYTTKTQYLKDTLYDIVVDRKTGQANYTHEHMQNKPKLTPYKVYSKVLILNLWEYIKRQNLIPEIPKHLKSLFFIKLKSNAWDFIKRWVYTKKLNMEYPDNVEHRAFIEKTSAYKSALDELIKEISTQDLELTYLLQYGILDYTINQVLNAA